MLGTSRLKGGVYVDAALPSHVSLAKTTVSIWGRFGFTDSRGGASHRLGCLRSWCDPQDHCIVDVHVRVADRTRVLQSRDAVGMPIQPIQRQDGSYG